jgi:hypothetical protein
LTESTAAAGTDKASGHSRRAKFAASTVEVARRDELLPKLAVDLSSNLIEEIHSSQ